MTLFLKAPLLLNTSPSNILIAFFWVEEMLGAKKGFLQHHSALWQGGSCERDGFVLAAK